MRVYHSLPPPADLDLADIPPPPPAVEEFKKSQRKKKSKILTGRLENLNPLRLGRKQKKSIKYESNFADILNGSSEDNLFVEAPMTSEEDFNFVDYTVVPLLLRAGLDYATANNFGTVLKNSYSGRKSRQVMSNPFELFAALEKEGFKLSDDIKFNVVDDKFWRQDQSQAGSRRTSFVYYKAEVASRNARRQARQRTTSTTSAKDSKYKTIREKVRTDGEQFGSEKTRRMSAKSEFLPERSINPGESEDTPFAIDMDEVRRSMQVLTEGSLYDQALAEMSNDVLGPSQRRPSAQRSPSRNQPRSVDRTIDFTL